VLLDPILRSRSGRDKLAPNVGGSSLDHRKVWPDGLPYAVLQPVSLVAQLA
jgi:hypothetical protein